MATEEVEEADQPVVDDAEVAGDAEAPADTVVKIDKPAATTASDDDAGEAATGEARSGTSSTTLLLAGLVLVMVVQVVLMAFLLRFQIQARDAAVHADNLQTCLEKAQITATSTDQERAAFQDCVK